MQFCKSPFQLRDVLGIRGLELAKILLVDVGHRPRLNRVEQPRQAIPLFMPVFRGHEASMLGARDTILASDDSYRCDFPGCTHRCLRRDSPKSLNIRAPTTLVPRATPQSVHPRCKTRVWR